MGRELAHQVLTFSLTLDSKGGVTTLLLPAKSGTTSRAIERAKDEEVADSSFDVVSKIDPAELDNAINQTSRELETRFDFKGTGTSIEKSNVAITIESETEDRAKAALEVFKEKLVKRNVSLKSISAKDPMLSGKSYRIVIETKEGISQENAKKITKLLRDEGPKSIKAQIQGDELRVSSKSRDDLQAAIALIKGASLDFAVQFTNYR